MSELKIKKIQYECSIDRQVSHLLSKATEMFPFDTPYPQQISSMKAILKAIVSNQNLLFQSPTGTGKSLMILASVFAFLQSQDRQEEYQILYLTRTKGQINGLVKELNKMKGDQNLISKYAILGGRINFCLLQSEFSSFLKEQKQNNNVYDKKYNKLYSQHCNDCRNKSFNKQNRVDVSKVVNVSKPILIDPQECQSIKLQDKKNSCQHFMVNQFIELNEMKFEGFAKMDFVTKNNFSEKRMPDIEDMVNLMKQQDGQCPFYFNRYISKQANIVLMNYNYLLNPKILGHLSKEVLNTERKMIVIFDEAHNIEQQAENQYNYKLKYKNIKKILVLISAMQKTIYLAQEMKILDTIIEIGLDLIDRQKDKERKLASRKSSGSLDSEQNDGIQMDDAEIKQEDEDNSDCDEQQDKQYEVYDYMALERYISMQEESYSQFTYSTNCSSNLNSMNHHHSYNNRFDENSYYNNNHNKTNNHDLLNIENQSSSNNENNGDESNSKNIISNDKDKTNPENSHQGNPNDKSVCKQEKNHIEKKEEDCDDGGDGDGDSTPAQKANNLLLDNISQDKNNQKPDQQSIPSNDSEEEDDDLEEMQRILDLSGKAQKSSPIQIEFDDKYQRRKRILKEGFEKFQRVSRDILDYFKRIAGFCHQQQASTEKRPECGLMNEKQFMRKFYDWFGMNQDLIKREEKEKNLLEQFNDVINQEENEKTHLEKVLDSIYEVKLFSQVFNQTIKCVKMKYMRENDSAKVEIELQKILKRDVNSIRQLKLCLNKFAKFAHNASPNYQLSKVEIFLNQMKDFFRLSQLQKNKHHGIQSIDVQKLDDYYFSMEKTDEIAKSQFTEQDICFKIGCLSAKYAFRDILSHLRVHSLILASGTLEPFDSLEKALEIPFQVFRGEHVIDPKSQLFVKFISSESQFDSKPIKQKEPMKKEFAKICSDNQENNSPQKTDQEITFPKEVEQEMQTTKQEIQLESVSPLQSQYPQESQLENERQNSHIIQAPRVAALPRYNTCYKPKFTTFQQLNQCNQQNTSSPHQDEKKDLKKQEIVPSSIIEQEHKEQTSTGQEPFQIIANEIIKEEYEEPRIARLPYFNVCYKPPQNINSQIQSFSSKNEMKSSEQTLAQNYESTTTTVSSSQQSYFQDQSLVSIQNTEKECKIEIEPPPSNVFSLDQQIQNLNTNEDTSNDSSSSDSLDFNFCYQQAQQLFASAICPSEGEKEQQDLNCQVEQETKLQTSLLPIEPPIQQIIKSREKWVAPLPRYNFCYQPPQVPSQLKKCHELIKQNQEICSAVNHSQDDITSIDTEQNSQETEIHEDTRISSKIRKQSIRKMSHSIDPSKQHPYELQTEENIINSEQQNTSKSEIELEYDNFDNISLEDAAFYQSQGPISKQIFEKVQQGIIMSTSDSGTQIKDQEINEPQIIIEQQQQQEQVVQKENDTQIKHNDNTVTMEQEADITLIADHEQKDKIILQSEEKCKNTAVTSPVDETLLMHQQQENSFITKDDHEPKHKNQLLKQNGDNLEISQIITDINDQFNLPSSNKSVLSINTTNQLNELSRISQIPQNNNLIISEEIIPNESILHMPTTTTTTNKETNLSIIDLEKDNLNTEMDDQRDLHISKIQSNQNEAITKNKYSSLISSTQSFSIFKRNNIFGNLKPFKPPLKINKIPTTLNFSYKSMQEEDQTDFQLNSAKRIIEKIVAKIQEEKIKGGIIIFFKCYQLMTQFQSIFIGSPFCKQISQSISCFTESRSNKEFQDDFAEFKKQVLVKNKAAIFFAACRGKLAEGIDLKDALSRCIILVGSPFQYINDPYFICKKKYISQILKQNSNEWMRSQAVKCVNQAAGRSIRHKNDWGSVFFLCETFDQPHNPFNLKKFISQWILLAENEEDNIVDSYQQFLKFQKDRDENKQKLLMKAEFNEKKEFDWSLLDSDDSDEDLEDGKEDEDVGQFNEERNDYYEEEQYNQREYE